MPHGCIDPKKIAGLGQALLEEAILAVLAEARAENKGSLTNKEISELAGIYRHSGHSADYGIVRLLADKLCGDKRISNERDSTYGPQDDHWKLVKPPDQMKHPATYDREQWIWQDHNPGNSDSGNG